MPHGKQTDTKYEIWLEDSKSIEAKLKLMKKYKLAGTARVVSWTGEFGYLESNPEICQLIKQNNR